MPLDALSVVFLAVMTVLFQNVMPEHEIPGTPEGGRPGGPTEYRLQ